MIKFWPMRDERERCWCGGASEKDVFTCKKQREEEMICFCWILFSWDERSGTAVAILWSWRELPEGKAKPRGRQRHHMERTWVLNISLNHWNSNDGVNLSQNYLLYEITSLLYYLSLSESAFLSLANQSILNDIYSLAQHLAHSEPPINISSFYNCIGFFS